MANPSDSSPIGNTQSPPLLPPCFLNRAEFGGWVRAAWETKRPDNPVTNFCFDCTPEYKREMLDEQRCIRPDTAFAVVLPSQGDEDTEPSMQGLRPRSLAVLRRLKRIDEASIVEVV